MQQWQMNVGVSEDSELFSCSIWRCVLSKTTAGGRRRGRDKGPASRVDLRLCREDSALPGMLWLWGLFVQLLVYKFCAPLFPALHKSYRRPRGACGGREGARNPSLLCTSTLCAADKGSAFFFQAPREVLSLLYPV